jgi:hypothetical protein
MNNGIPLGRLDPIDEEPVGMKNQNVPNSQMSIPKKQRLNPESGNEGGVMDYNGGKSRSSKKRVSKTRKSTKRYRRDRRNRRRTSRK